MAVYLEANVNKAQDIQQHLTRHARDRQRHRGIGPDIVEMVLTWGRPLRQSGGREAVFVGDAEVSMAAKAGDDIRAAAGVAVVAAADGAIVTVLRAESTTRLRRFASVRGRR